MLENQEQIRKKENHRVFKQLLNTFIEEKDNTKKEPVEYAKNIKILPKIYYDDFNKRMKIEFRMGDKQFYKIKNLPDFYTKMLHQEPYQYGTKLSLVHTRDSFSEEALPILDFILKYAEIMKYSNDDTENYTYYKKAYTLDNIFISNMGLDDLFQALEGTSVTFQRNTTEKSVYFSAEEPNIPFSITQLKDNQFQFQTDIDIFDYDILEGKDYNYLLFKDTLYCCSKEFQDSTLKVLEVLRKNYTNKITIDETELTSFFAIIAPSIPNKIEKNNLSPEIEKRCIPKPLGVKMYLDYNKNNHIVADIRFCYEDIEINPLLDEKVEIARNIIKENKVLNQLIRTGFMLDKSNSRLILVKDDSIYNFLSEEMEEYMQKYEILVTDAFKKKEIHGFQMKNLGIRIENNLLEIDLSQIGIDVSDLTEMLQKYQLKKKFHRLKDGSYIKLEDNETMQFLEDFTTNMELDPKDLSEGTITLPVYRTLYLDKMLKALKNVEIRKDSTYQDMIEKLENSQQNFDIETPTNLNADLRNYQKLGYKWLKTLDQYHFGGILADDMGLGKTLQILAVILSYVNSQKEENKKTQPSMVVCPSSLTLNWLGEIEKFSPTLKAIVISGNAQDREKKIKTIDQYDIAITSYDSLKRDIEVYQGQMHQFKYMIADEAQYIKNNNTQNAKAIKKITAQTRFALTGTPIENSLSELWSIFDFIMPGYLFKYRKFKEIYELAIVKENDEEKMQKLKKMIEPFVLRRIKKEVLTELPDKTVTTLYNEMEEEQQKIYLSYLAQAKKEVADEIQANGFENSQIKILALLMRLRQICCHPSLFLQDYEGESSKLSQCIEVITDAVAGGHKILLFSGYTSMFNIIEKELKKKEITYLKLTGQTKVSERIELVDKFNQEKDIKVFLISLKAGGTGLNLTGADMVIHYDPWWNISAENQATDRTYRIGQKNNVQVYKLITKNSIEEKIYELQKKKEKLVDNMLSTQNTFINQLSKEDIMELFG